MAAMGVGRSLGGAPDFLPLGCSPKPAPGTHLYYTASTRHGSQPVIEPETPVGMKQVLLG